MADKGPDDAAGEIGDIIDSVVQPFTPAELYALGDQAINIMLLRTRRGVDADHRPFVAYSPGYKKKRQEMGRSSDVVDLAVTGHMQQAMTRTAGSGEVVIRFLSRQEAIKAAAHNYGVTAGAGVRAHSRSTFYDTRTGRRVSRDEARKDARRKNKRVASRTESVSGHSRTMRLPQREWFDVRFPADVDVLADACGRAVQGHVEKVLAR